MGNNMYYSGYLNNGGYGNSTDIMDFGAGGVKTASTGQMPTQTWGQPIGATPAATTPLAKSLKPVTAPGGNTPGGAGGSGFLGGLDIGVLGGIANTAASWMMGNKQLDHAQEQFDFQKESWEKRFAMMQDQYYRKINNRRAGRYLDEGMSESDRRNLGEYYDTGANQSNPYPGASEPAQGSFHNSGFVGPTNQNASMMDQATGGAPYSPEAAQSMMGESAFTTPPMAGAEAMVKSFKCTRCYSGKRTCSKRSKS